MEVKRIESLQNSLVKHWVTVRSDKTYREETGRVLIAGEKVIRELAKEIPIESLITLRPSDIPAKEHYVVPEQILKKITGLNQPDGYAAEIALPAPQDLSEKKYLLILDCVADPGNLGTLIRTALALNWEGIIVTPGTVDLFNDKALRASRGAIFHLPYAKLEKGEIISLLKKKHFAVFLADLHGEKLEELSMNPPTALILSNEAKGAGSWADSISRKVTIPMGEKSESLNVASSGAILLYTMGPQ